MAVQTTEKEEECKSDYPTLFTRSLELTHYASVAAGLYPHGLNYSPGPCIGVAGAMSAGRIPCTVVRFIVWQHQLDVNICNGDAR